MDCAYCGKECHVVVVDDYVVSWGKYTEFGEQLFTLDGVECWQCGSCEEGGYFTWDQCMNYEFKLNELIKDRLGFDWLGANKIRRGALLL